MPTTKKPKPKPINPKPDRRTETMPSAPTDPAARREWVWQRNARIQGVRDVDAYMTLMRDQYDRNLRRGSDLPKEKP
jgi:hypothetical protein